MSIHYRLRHIGYCGEMSPDKQKGCILPIGHRELHPWDSPQQVFVVEVIKHFDGFPGGGHSSREWVPGIWELVSVFVTESAARDFVIELSSAAANRAGLRVVSNTDSFRVRSVDVKP